MTFRRARRGAVETRQRIPAARVPRASGCKNAFDQLLFPRVPLRYALPGRSWRLVPNKTESLPRPRRGRCPHRPVAAASSRDSQRQRKEKLVNATTTPMASVPSATGRQSQESQKRIACPKARQNRRLHRYADPRAREGPLHRSAPKRFFLLDRPRPVLFLSRTKGAPAAPCAVGKGGARERAQFSPQAETELSGLCDDAMGGAPPWERPPGGASIPLAAVRRPAFSPPPRAGGLLKSASPRPGSADSVSIL